MTQPPKIEAAPQQATFSVLFVCSANLCRSVTAEVLMRRALEQHLTIPFPCWTVSSAGTDVRPKAMLPDETASMMEQLGIVQPNPPRMLGADLIESSDLILTAERAHRARIVATVPSANRKTFTIRQFDRFARAGRSAEHVGFTSSGARLVELATTGRSLLQPVGGDEDDVFDPVADRTAAAMYDCALQIAACIDGIVGHAGLNGVR